MNSVFHHKYIACSSPEDTYLSEILWLSDKVLDNNTEIIEMAEQLVLNITRLALVMVDSRQMYFVIDPNFQIKYEKNSTRKFLGLGCQRLALVLSHKFLANLSIHQFVEEVEDLKFNDGFQIMYFIRAEEAKDWLNSFL